MFIIASPTLLVTYMTGMSAGPPQIVGIDRRPNSPAITFGILHNGSRYFLGAKIDDLQNFDKVLWLNENFERCDGITMKKLPLAQSQPDPLRRP
jgi:hypothetical protein